MIGSENMMMEQNQPVEVEYINGEKYTYLSNVYPSEGNWTTVIRKKKESRRYRVTKRLYEGYLRELSREEYRDSNLKKELWNLARETEKSKREEMCKLRAEEDKNYPERKFRREEKDNHKHYVSRMKRSGEYLVKIEEALGGVKYTPEEHKLRAEWNRDVLYDRDLEEPEELYEARLKSMRREEPLDGRYLSMLRYNHQNWDPVVARRHVKKTSSSSGVVGKMLHGLKKLDEDTGNYKNKKYEKSFVQKVRSEREKRGLSQKDVSSLLNVTENEYKRFENGELMYDERLMSLLKWKLLGSSTSTKEE